MKEKFKIPDIRKETRELVAKIFTPERKKKMRIAARRTIIGGTIVVAGVGSVFGFDVVSRRTGGKGIDPVLDAASQFLPGYVWMVVPDTDQPGCAEFSFLAQHRPVAGETVQLRVDPFVDEPGISENLDGLSFDLSGKSIAGAWMRPVCLPKGARNGGFRIEARNGTVREKGDIYRFDK